MCSINHDLKCVYLHLPKCGGSYITDILEKIYDFKTFYFTSENHHEFIDDDLLNCTNYSLDRGFFYIKKLGMYRYFRYSEKFNILTGMDENKWNEYFKFTFVRHPFDKFISAYKYLKLNMKNINFLDIIKNENILNPYEFFHISIPLYDNIVNNKNIIEFNYVAQYENLNEELIYVLNKLGINEIKHQYYIINDIVINSSDSKKYFSSLKNNIEQKYNIDDFINDEFINLFNNKFNTDYTFFNYEPVNLINYKKFIYNNKQISINNNKIIHKYNLNKINDNCFYFTINKK